VSAMRQGNDVRNDGGKNQGLVVSRETIESVTPSRKVRGYWCFALRASGVAFQIIIHQSLRTQLLWAQLINVHANICISGTTVPIMQTFTLQSDYKSNSVGLYR
jgi:hypothetical protein